MGRSPDFIGVGAQKAGTSWIYLCLYEHPQVCIPQKEIRFFSRDRNWSKGYDWYESLFERCDPEKVAGEFDTSYLVDSATPARIRQRYPDVKIIASLRNPADRAYSNYLNDIMAGSVDWRTPFREAFKEHPEYLEQGRYGAQVRRYLDIFPRGQMLLLVYEDAAADPTAFMQTIYSFVGVDTAFRPSMLFTRVNEGRVPRYLWVERALRGTSRFMRSKGLVSLWWYFRRVGVGNRIRSANSRRTKPKAEAFKELDRKLLIDQLEDDISMLEGILGRDLSIWRA